jgi:hypothetical protein
VCEGHDDLMKGTKYRRTVKSFRCDLGRVEMGKHE